MGRGNTRAAGRSPLFPAMVLSGKENSEEEAGLTCRRQKGAGSVCTVPVGVEGVPLAHPLQQRVSGSRQAGTSPSIPPRVGALRASMDSGPEAQAASLGTAPWLVWSLPAVPTLPVLGASQKQLLAPPPAPLLQEAVLVLVWVWGTDPVGPLLSSLPSQLSDAVASRCLNILLYHYDFFFHNVIEIHPF